MVLVVVILGDVDGWADGNLGENLPLVLEAALRGLASTNLFH